MSKLKQTAAAALAKPVSIHDLVKQLKEKKQSSEGRAAAFIEIAENIIATLAEEGLRLAASISADNDTIALYTISADGVVSSISEHALESIVFKSNPQLLASGTREVMRIIRFKTFNESQIDPSTVQPVAFADESETLTWNRLKFKRSDLKGGCSSLEEMPAFTHILSLCNDPRSLVLWIGSLLDPHAGRTQYLHIHGGGGNGKSTLFNAIAQVLGEQHVVRTRADEFMNQHWGSVVEGAGLLIFPDENNPGFFSTGKFKEFTGEEAVTVNPKYEKPRSIRLTHKTAVFSNNKVEISSNAADRRRLLSISMSDDPDSNVGFRWWYEELKNSGEAILAYCFHQYEEALKKDPSIRAFISQEPEVIQAAIERKYSEVVEVLKESYAFTGETSDYVRASTVHAAVAEALRERRTNRVFLQQVSEALAHLGAVEGSVSGYRVYRGIKKASASLSAATLPRIVK